MLRIQKVFSRIPSFDFPILVILQKTEAKKPRKGNMDYELIDFNCVNIQPEMSSFANRNTVCCWTEFEWVSIVLAAIWPIILVSYCDLTQTRFNVQFKNNIKLKLISCFCTISSYNIIATHNCMQQSVYLQSLYHMCLYITFSWTYFILNLFLNILNQKTKCRLFSNVSKPLHEIFY